MSTRSHWPLLAILAITFLALAVRLYDISVPTLSHPEGYIPRIPYPAQATSPVQRLTLTATLTGTVEQDVHPPGFYVLMWLWTGCFGIGLLAMRLPSALLGAATVPSLFKFSAPRDGLPVALFASLLLALNGHHAMWSQQARMYTMIGFLAIVSSTALLKLCAAPSRWRLAAYTALAALGLWTEYYFWLVFLGQLLWSCGDCARAGRLTRALYAQLLALVLASPVIVMAKVHGESQEYLAGSITEPLVHLLGFARMLQSDFTRQSWPTAGPALLAVVSIAGTFLLLVGIRARYKDSQTVSTPAAVDALASPRAALVPLIVAAAIVSACVLMAPQFLFGARPKLTATATVLPWVMIVGWVVLTRLWQGLVPIFRRLFDLPVVRHLLSDLVVAQAILPILVLATVSLIKPVIAERGLIVVTPFYLLLMARGARSALCATAPRAMAWAAAVALGAVSLWQFHEVPRAAHDYQGLAAALRSQLRATDVVYVANNWWSQPVHYYLPPDHVHSVATLDGVAGDRSGAAAHSSRVWLVAFNVDTGQVDRDLSRLVESLPGFHESLRVHARGAGAVLAERSPPAVADSLQQ